jgi:hypothetical protein
MHRKSKCRNSQYTKDDDSHNLMVNLSICRTKKRKLLASVQGYSAVVVGYGSF